VNKRRRFIPPPLFSAATVGPCELGNLRNKYLYNNRDNRIWRGRCTNTTSFIHSFALYSIPFILVCTVLYSQVYKISLPLPTNPPSSQYSSTIQAQSTKHNKTHTNIIYPHRSILAPPCSMRCTAPFQKFPHPGWYDTCTVANFHTRCIMI